MDIVKILRMHPYEFAHRAADEIERLRAELSAERTRCAAIARQMNAPQVAGAIEGAK